MGVYSKCRSTISALRLLFLTQVRTWFIFSMVITWWLSDFLAGNRGGKLCFLFNFQFFAYFGIWFIILIVYYIANVRESVQWQGHSMKTTEWTFSFCLKKSLQSSVKAHFTEDPLKSSSLLSPSSSPSYILQEWRKKFKIGSKGHWIQSLKTH